MAVRMILLDLDGTLLTGDKRISPRNYGALERAAAGGIEIVPATGRFYRGVPDPVRALPFTRYAVTVNGAQIYDIRHDAVLHRAEIPMALAERIFDALERLPVIFDGFQNDRAYMDRRFYERIDEYIADPQVNEMVKRLRQPVEDFRAYVRTVGADFQKIQMFFRDMDMRARALPALAAAFPECAVSSSIANNIELNIAAATKGNALAALCELLKVDIKYTMAFGDMSNDAPMLRAAGIGVAMGNADEELKNIADHVTDTNDNDGVAKAIERFCF